MLYYFTDEFDPITFLQNSSIHHILKKKISSIIKFLIFVGIGVSIFWWFYNNQNTAFQEQLRLDGKPPRSLASKLFEDFRSVDVFWISMTLLAFSISNWSRSVRWRMLVRPLGVEPKLFNLFAAVNISYLTNLWMSRAGEVVRAGTVARYEGLSLSRTMGTVIVDRLLDMISLALIMAFAIFIQFDTVWGYLSQNAKLPSNPLSSPLVIGFLSISLLGAVLLWWFRAKIFATKIGQKIREILSKMWEGSKTVKQLENRGLFIFHSINIWLMYYLMTYFCFFAFSPTAHLSPWAALTVFVFGSFGIVIPSPGGMGTYHVLATAALSIYGVESNDAFSFANIVFFSIQIFYNIVVGGLSMILLPILNPKRTQEVDPLHIPSDEEIMEAIDVDKM
jgi:uncharacterized protein (TIRG00374 family)